MGICWTLHLSSVACFQKVSVSLRNFANAALNWHPQLPYLRKEIQVISMDLILSRLWRFEGVADRSGPPADFPKSVGEAPGF